jgi:hypothetical protein
MALSQKTWKKSDRHCPFRWLLIAQAGHRRAKIVEAKYEKEESNSG